ncbi:hypothetical protein ACQ4M3_05310 [Leptolyngbya sp. AN03gr2]|uniref:hypothetical protein n=1 Tax=unclassified Leptolyngbya TaxID=2650499 RepID=UPI003D31F2D7
MKLSVIIAFPKALRNHSRDTSHYQSRSDLSVKLISDPIVSLKSESKQSRSKQLGLLAESWAVSTTPDLILLPVPRNLALEADRFYVSCGDWFAGVQLTIEQAYRAIELCGKNREPDRIWWAIERAIDGGLK